MPRQFTGTRTRRNCGSSFDLCSKMTTPPERHDPKRRRAHARLLLLKPANLRSVPRGKSTKFTDLRSSALRIRELCSYFALFYRKNVNPAQAPWLTVAHLAVDPEHSGPTSADDHLLGLESGVGIAGEPPTPEFDHNGLSLYASAIRSGRRILKHCMLVKNAANPSASCRLNTLLKLSMVERVACSWECTFSWDLMETSLGKHRLPSRNTEQVPPRRGDLRSAYAFDPP